MSTNILIAEDDAMLARNIKGYFEDSEFNISCVEDGFMTKDLAILIGPSSKYLTTNQFLDVIEKHLKKKLN